MMKLFFLFNSQKCTKLNLTGPELAKLMKIGTRIVRGTDWKWGDQDGPSGEGRIISEVGDDGCVFKLERIPFTQFLINLFFFSISEQLGAR